MYASAPVVRCFHRPSPSALHTAVGFAGDHWWGWHPSKFAIDDVAKRVCPWKRAGAAMFAASSSDLYFFISRSQRSVRLPFTTRFRTPTAPPSAARWYVTRPADCAPRIIVTRSIVSMIFFTLSECAACRRSSPKLPQKKVDAAAAGGTAPSRSDATPSSAVAHSAPSGASERRPEETDFAHHHVAAPANIAEETHPAWRIIFSAPPVAPGTWVLGGSSETRGENPRRIAVAA